MWQHFEVTCGAGMDAPSTILSNDGNFMERFLAAQAEKSEPKSAEKSPQAEKSEQKEVSLSNDGNFMERFLAAQEAAAAATTTSSSAEGLPDDSSNPTEETERKFSEEATRKRPSDDMTQEEELAKADKERRKRERRAKRWGPPTDVATIQSLDTEKPTAASLSGVQPGHAAVAAAVAAATAKINANFGVPGVAPDAMLKAQMDTFEDAVATGGYIPGGTWEHRKRQEEMEKTAQVAQQMTDQNRGKHHISDFMPKEALDKFMNKATALSTGQAYDDPDKGGPQIGESNIGFKMLQKAGWSQGSGLGSASNGINAPIAAVGHGSAGLGSAAADEVQEGDDAFDQYRKRMMTAYRYRPNPFNNPRRGYDGYTPSPNAQ